MQMQLRATATLVVLCLGVACNLAFAGTGKGNSPVGNLDSYPPRVDILYPTEIIVVQGQSVVDFRWTVDDDFPSYNFFDHFAFILFDGVVQESLPFTYGQTEYIWSWTAPDTTMSNCRLKILAKDYYGNFTLEFSERFTIIPATTEIPPGPLARTDLLPPRPNPFNPGTVISFDLAQVGGVHLNIYDSGGRALRTLKRGEVMEAGRHQIYWDGRTDSGRDVASGVYFCRLWTPFYNATMRMLLIK